MLALYTQKFGDLLTLDLPRQLRNFMQIKSVRITRRVGGLKGDESAALLSICLDQLDEVTLDYCSITSVGVGELATAIKLRTVPVSSMCSSDW